MYIYKTMYSHQLKVAFYLNAMHKPLEILDVIMSKTFPYLSSSKTYSKIKVYISPLVGVTDANVT